jgi:hypothetical protein
VFKPALRYGGEIGIVTREQLIWAGVVFCLNQPTLRAHIEFKGEVYLRSGQVFRFKVGIGGWGKAEIQKNMLQFGTAMAAVHRESPLKSSFMKG